MDKPLSPKQELFAQAVVKYANQSQAYRMTYDCTNYTAGTIVQKASALANSSRVKSRIGEIRDRVLESVNYGAKDLINNLIEIVNADPGELTKMRRLCCRHCYGKNHLYQWRNEAEIARAAATIVDFNAYKSPKTKEKPMPDVRGGTGFDKTFAPHPECPECHGEGHEDIYFADTRFISKGARRLFAGVKRTKDGLEIKTRDQDASARLLSQIMGLTKDGGVTINNNGPTAISNNPLPSDPLEAAKVYAALMQGR